MKYDDATKTYIFPNESEIQMGSQDESVDEIEEKVMNIFKETLFNIYPPNEFEPSEESTDLYVRYDDEQFPFNYYKNFLEQIIHLYERKYEVLKRQKAYNVVNDYNIQYYKPNQGFKDWHCERMDNSNRNLVFMTYLNDVEDGGTEFKYQNIITTAKKGLTLIWPTDFTHTHKGQISKTNEKYIITGWMGYL
jgi:hypothetical protein